MRGSPQKHCFYPNKPNKPNKLACNPTQPKFVPRKKAEPKVEPKVEPRAEQNNNMISLKEFIKLNEFIIQNDHPLKRPAKNDYERALVNNPIYMKHQEEVVSNKNKDSQSRRRFAVGKNSNIYVKYISDCENTSKYILVYSDKSPPCLYLNNNEDEDDDGHEWQLY